MILVDANLLIYAVDAGSIQHAPAKAWWDRQLSGKEPVGFSWLVISAFVRITTNPRMVHQPISFEQAAAEIDSWLAQPCARVLNPSNSHWSTFKRLFRAAGPSSNLVNYAHLAARAIDYGFELCSTDEDFAKFPGLKWHNPLRPASGASAT